MVPKASCVRAALTQRAHADPRRAPRARWHHLPPGGLRHAELLGRLGGVRVDEGPENDLTAHVNLKFTGSTQKLGQL